MVWRRHARLGMPRKFPAAAKYYNAHSGHGGCLRAVLLVVVFPFSEHVLRLLDVALIRYLSDTPVGALIFPPMATLLQEGCGLDVNRALAPPELRHIAWSMLLDIAHLHSHNIVHMDLKPGSALPGVGL